MKLLQYTIFVFLFFATLKTLTAQNPSPGSNCGSSAVLCNPNASFSNQTGVASLGSVSCAIGTTGANPSATDPNLATTPNPAFYTFVVSQSGTFNIQISQSNGDVDFALWGPYSTAGGLTAPCSGNFPTGTPIDCDYSPSATEVANFTGTVGQMYVLMVTNFANTSGLITLTPLAGTTGAIGAPIVLNSAGPFTTASPAIQLTTSPPTNDPAVTGEIFSGPGTSSGGLFTPSSAGVGTHTVTVSANSYGCNVTDNVQITVTGCAITATGITLGACNDNGTPSNSTDDYYTATVTVTYSTPPSSGTLDLSGNAIHSSTPAANLTASAPFNATTTTFSGVRINANTLGGTVTSTFSAETTCTFSNNAVTTGASCSTPPACSITGLAPGVQTPCVSATNEYTQEVIVTYSNPPTSGSLTVNGQNFAITSSPQTVTLTGLISNGAAVNVTASFTASPSCTLTQNNLFTAPASCLVVCPTVSTPASGTVTVCSGTVPPNPPTMPTLSSGTIPATATISLFEDAALTIPVSGATGTNSTCAPVTKTIYVKLTCVANGANIPGAGSYTLVVNPSAFNLTLNSTSGGCGVAPTVTLRCNGVDLSGSLVTGTAPTQPACGTGTTNSSLLTGSYTTAQIEGFLGASAPSAGGSCYTTTNYNVPANCTAVPCACPTVTTAASGNEDQCSSSTALPTFPNPTISGGVLGTDATIAWFDNAAFTVPATAPAANNTCTMVIKTYYARMTCTASPSSQTSAGTYTVTVYPNPANFAVTVTPSAACGTAPTVVLGSCASLSTNSIVSAIAGCSTDTPTSNDPVNGSYNIVQAALPAFTASAPSGCVYPNPVSANGTITGCDNVGCINCNIANAGMTVSSSCSGGNYVVTLNPTGTGLSTTYTVTYGAATATGTYGTPLVLNIPTSSASVNFTIEDDGASSCSVSVTATRPIDTLPLSAYNAQSGLCLSAPQVTLPSGYTCAYTYLSGQGACSGVGPVATYCIAPITGNSGTVQFTVTTPCSLTQTLDVNYSCVECNPNHGTQWQRN